MNFGSCEPELARSLLRVAREFDEDVRDDVHMLGTCDLWCGGDGGGVVFSQGK